MKKARLNGNRQKKEKEVVTSGAITFKGVIITVISIIIVFGAFYFLTYYLLDNRATTVLDNTPEDNSNEISFNDLYKQEEDEYHVFAMIEDDINKDKYNVYTSAIKNFYTIDMTDVFNKKHLGKEVNVDGPVKDIKINDTTLFVIKDNKLEAYYVGYEEIKEYILSSM